MILWCKCWMIAWAAGTAAKRPMPPCSAPSFYRADMVFNPSRWDRMRQALRSAVIGFFQARAARRRALTAF